LGAFSSLVASKNISTNTVRDCSWVWAHTSESNRKYPILSSWTFDMAVDTDMSNVTCQGGLSA
jgi:hypothetical protein